MKIPARYRNLNMNLLLPVLLYACVFGNEFKLDTNDICKYAIRKANNDSTFHKYGATLSAKSRFDSLISFFRSRVRPADTSLKNLNKLSGGLFTDANNHMTYPIIRRTNEIIEEYCAKNKIDIFIIYPPEAIQYANGETNDFPEPADSTYLKLLGKCPVPDVTDTVIRLLNKDPGITNVLKDIDKEYERYKLKVVLKTDSLLKEKRK
jgi:hypothetical protein